MLHDLRRFLNVVEITCFLNLLYFAALCFFCICAEFEHNQEQVALDTEDDNSPAANISKFSSSSQKEIGSPLIP